MSNHQYHFTRNVLSQIWINRCSPKFSYDNDKCVWHMKLCTESIHRRFGPKSTSWHTTQIKSMHKWKLHVYGKYMGNDVCRASKVSTCVEIINFG